MIKSTGENPLYESYEIINLYTIADGGLIFLNAENEVIKNTWSERNLSTEEMVDYLSDVVNKRMQFIKEAKYNLAGGIASSDNQ